MLCFHGDDFVAARAVAIPLKQASNQLEVSDSVAPLVHTISRGSAPIVSAPSHETTRPLQRPSSETCVFEAGLHRYHQPQDKPASSRSPPINRGCGRIIKVGCDHPVLPENCSLVRPTHPSVLFHRGLANLHQDT